MATIRKRGDRYHVQIRRKGFPTVTRSFTVLSDAKEWARHTERQADRRELGPDRKALAGITLAELARRYRDTVLPGKKGGDFETVVLNAFLRHSICRKTLADLTPSDFAQWRDERISGRKGRKGITAKSAKRLLSPVQHMFTVAIDEWGVPLNENPVAKLKWKVIDNRRERRLREGELRQLLESGRQSRNPYTLLIIRFALETAMRRGEVLSLRWRDVDLERRSAIVRESKNGYSRTIPLTAAAIAILRDATKLAKKESVERNGLIFPVAANAFKLVWRRLVTRAKIPDLHFHDLRHEAISRLFELGLTVPEAASISGHRDMRMLFRYAHANHGGETPSRHGINSSTADSSGVVVAI